MPFMKEKGTEFMDVSKKIIRHYLFAFICVFICLFVNQLLLARNVLTEGQLSVSQKLMLMLYLIPPIIVMGAPFAVSIGFVQGLAEMNIAGKIAKDGKKVIIKTLLMPLLALSLIISALAFVVSDYVLPGANASVAYLYRTALLKKAGEQTLVSLENTPRHMTSKMVIQEIKNIQTERGDGFEKKLNLWKLELHKKYSIPLGALFLCFFAITLSLVIRDRKKAGLCICLISCVLYWALLTYGQTFSTRSEKYGVLVMWLPNILFLFISCILYLCYKMMSLRSD
jgi:lipopolysaccharide export LptBFGC system permease protein LptF